MRLFNHRGVRPPETDFSKAAAKETIGAACDVPDSGTSSLSASSQEEMRHPGAATSTALDPRLLKSESLLLASTDATVRTLSMVFAPLTAGSQRRSLASRSSLLLPAATTNNVLE